MLHQAATSPLSFLTLILSALNLTVAAAAVNLEVHQADEAHALVTTRQQVGNGGTLPMVVSCVQYAFIANLSTISSNSSYRAAWLRSSPAGTLESAGLLNAAQAQLPLLVNDATLNAQCGNSTATAIVEAATNFTNGIVGPFTILTAPGVGLTGPEVPIAVVLITLIMAGTWLGAE